MSANDTTQTTEKAKKIGITELVLRDAQQSLLATRLTIDDMLPIATQLDNIGFHSMEVWGGATFDSCIRFLNENPWDRLRELKRAMPKTKHQVLLRGQNILGYRHYADDVVTKFIERVCHYNVDIIRVFDAMNDCRNLETSIKVIKENGAHAQAAISYTTSPVHNLEYWLGLTKELEDMGADSIAVKDMSGLLTPSAAYDLVKRIKSETGLQIQVHTHSTTGLAPMVLLKSIEAGADIIDTAISTMSNTSSHTATESMVHTLNESNEYSTGINLNQLEEIALYFRDVREKYSEFEGSLKGIDSRILSSQVPGGMLTNLESQLRDQKALHRMDEILSEIPLVRADFGYVPLVTPTSQIVGSQAVLNVLLGRYTSVSQESAQLISGEYGKPPAPFNEQLQKDILGPKKPTTCRPADNIDNEFDKIKENLMQKLRDANVDFYDSDSFQGDILIFALFPNVGLDFLIKAYRDRVKHLHLRPLKSPMAGTVVKVNVTEGDVKNGTDILAHIQSHKMGVVIRPFSNIKIDSVRIKEGDEIKANQTLFTVIKNN